MKTLTKLILASLILASLILASLILASLILALTSCTCTMYGEELARAILVYQSGK